MSKVVRVGDVLIGGNNPVTIQSMTNTDTSNVEETVDQILKLESLGCEIIRSAVNSKKDAESITKIKSLINIPFIADIQFNHKLAIMAAENGADCIRINPGNIGSEDSVKQVVKSCKEHNIPIRIGVNSGSISQKLIDKYNGVNVDSLVASALDEIKILEKYGFDNIKVSIKSSDVITNINANRKFREHSDYPIHLGVTESGNLSRGTVKSSIGIGALLADNIGDTIRVSLSENPVEEIPIAKQILQAVGKRSFEVEIISCPTCSRTGINLIDMVNELESRKNEIKYNKKIAVMGCVVNGPGEAREADYGITGYDNQGAIFKDGKIILKVPEEQLIDKLIQIINSESE